MKIRLDQYVFEEGYTESRQRAQALIMAGVVYVNNQKVDKAGYMVKDADKVEVRGKDLKYVSRGGYKLEKAIELYGLDLTDKICMDIGASTGGFTDCMLQNGASRVFSVDVGHDQLHSRLREDDRVVCLEGTDVRHTEELCKAVPLASLDLVTVDVSFISLRQVVPSILPFLKPDATLICLIKPQFEAGRESIGKNGLVKDVRVHKQILLAYLREFSEWGLPVKYMTFSPITGGEGNIEYLAVADRTSRAAFAPTEIAGMVDTARRSLRRNGT